MTKTNKEETIRLQIPIHKQIAGELEEIATKFERSVSWLAASLITNGIDNQKRYLDWLATRVLGQITGGRKRTNKIQCRQLPDSSDGEIVRIQVNLPKSLVEKIEEQARKNFRTTTNMASMLIVWTMDDEEIFIKFATSKFGKPVVDLMRRFSKKAA